jgi:hypothetical protein
VDAASTEEDRRFVSNIPHVLAAAEYLADNDLRRLALLERVWLRMVVLEIGRRRSDRAADAKTLVDQLGKDDGEAPDVLHQLRASETALAHAWLLLAP